MVATLYVVQRGLGAGLDSESRAAAALCAPADPLGAWREQADNAGASAPPNAAAKTHGATRLKSAKKRVFICIILSARLQNRPMAP